MVSTIITSHTQFRHLQEDVNGIQLYSNAEGSIDLTGNGITSKHINNNLWCHIIDVVSFIPEKVLNQIFFNLVNCNDDCHQVYTDTFDSGLFSQTLPKLLTLDSVRPSAYRGVCYQSLKVINVENCLSSNGACRLVSRSWYFRNKIFKASDRFRFRWRFV